jgi:hypothetical protein
LRRAAETMSKCYMVPKKIDLRCTNEAQHVGGSVLFIFRGTEVEVFAGWGKIQVRSWHS